MKRFVLIALCLAMVLSLAACGGAPQGGAETTAPAVTIHEHTWSDRLSFRPYPVPPANGAAFSAYYVCTSCRDRRGDPVDVYVNLDFEEENMSGFDYFERADRVSPFTKAGKTQLTGNVREGVWYADDLGQIFLKNDSPLADLGKFVISADVLLGPYAAKNTILGWGKSSETEASVYYFQLCVDEEGKVHYWKNFAEYADGTEAFSSLTLDREHWWHLELAVNFEEKLVTLSAGMYEDETLSTLTDFRVIGTADSILIPSGGRNYDVVRLSYNGGLVALDNFRISAGTEFYAALTR